MEGLENLRLSSQSRVMDMIKIYPPEVSAQQENILSMISDVKSRYERKYNPEQPMTAIIASRRPSRPEEFAKIEREFRSEIEPFLKMLADLEGYATITMVIEA